MPIFEDDEIDPTDFLHQQIEFNKKVKRLEEMRAEQREKDITWLEESFNATKD